MGGQQLHALLGAEAHVDVDRVLLKVLARVFVQPHLPRAADLRKAGAEVAVHLLQDTLQLRQPLGLQVQGLGSRGPRTLRVW